jgi:hypothetical protein
VHMIFPFIVLIIYLLIPLVGQFHIYHDLTYATCSFHAILTQVMEELGYPWYYAHITWSTWHLHFALGPLPFAVPLDLFNIWWTCAHSYETKESALIHALIYINVVLVTQLGMFAKRTMSWHVVTSSCGCAPLIF